MLIHIILSVFLVSMIIQNAQAQSHSKNTEIARVMFYNVENLFDINDDTLTQDEEFTPEGMRRWNNDRYYTKINKLSKVIMGVGEWQMPAMIGLCEVENRKVLNDLAFSTPLKRADFRVIHYDSPDRRGIDVAFLYRNEFFEPLCHTNINVTFPNDSSLTTRDILYVKGIIFDADTIHVFVNHWPSRYGGYLPTVPKRLQAAVTLRNILDSVFHANTDANILVMGDFNDELHDRSIRELIGNNETDADKLTALYDLIHARTGEGTIKYQGKWSVFDHIMVSKSLITGEKGIKTGNSDAMIFNMPFLFEEDVKYLGSKPFRTYLGFRYHGGYSDHLPVYLDLKKIKR